MKKAAEYVSWVVVALYVVAALTMVGCAAVPEPTPDASVVKVLVGEGHGSGVHIGRGLVLTAWHVTEVGAPRIKDRAGTTIGAETLWSSKTFDVALVRVDDHHSLGVSSLSCDLPPVGAAIEIVGNPYDNEWIHTRGTIASGLTSKEPITLGTKLPGWREVIIGDITAGPGNSGGPVFDERGRIVGLLVGGYSSPFSIIVPSRTVCGLLARA